MSSIGFPELVLLFVIGLLILGPERLPRVASQIGRWVGRARRTANQLRYQLEREIALADIEKSPPKPPKSSSENLSGASAADSDQTETDSQSVDETPADTESTPQSGTSTASESTVESVGRVDGGEDERKS